ncbi:MAG: hypothetical protein Q8Q59_07670 [Luteolibacter sp.]|jgi:hypothetical protein|nr:hypothetical protein [Luteolibacter sp.]
MNAITRFLMSGIISLSGCVLVGCGSARPDAMMPAAVTASHRSGKPIQAHVAGGAEYTAMGGPGITNEEFKQALESSLVKSGSFQSAGPGGYQLEAFIADIDQPVMGFSMRVNMDVSYTLRRGGSIIWRKSIRSTYVAATGEAFAGALRLRKATEGAARENIVALIRALDGQRL